MATPEPPDPFTPVSLGPLRLKNRFVKAATFEGPQRDNQVSDRLIEFHRQVAAGGVAMTTLAYCAVDPQGSTDGRTLVLAPGIEPGLRRLVDAVHGAGAALAAQIGHAGPVANPAATGHPALGPSRLWNFAALRRTLAAGEDDIARVLSSFAQGARLAAACGVDAIEVHVGHGYLLSAFLSPALNRRRDRWGGSLENRARLARLVLSEVRAAAGPGVALTAKLGMADGTHKGLWLDESLQVARWIAQDRTVDALELTAGSSLQNPMYMFRGEPPLAEMARVMPPLVRPGFRLLGRRFLRDYPYQEAYLLPLARQFRAAVDIPLIFLGGVSSLATATRVLQEGFSLVAMGRALLREPDLVARWQAGRRQDSLCIHCNKCVPTIYRGTHCVLAPPLPGPG